MTDNYLSNLFQNRSWTNSESEQYIRLTKQSGGDQDDKDGNAPNGGFPPLYPLETKVKEENESGPVKREFVGRKSSVSVKNIMEKRRHAVPFIVGVSNSEEDDGSDESTVELEDIRYFD